jgi:uncharacterized Fe-S cluster protein YjdI
MDASREIIKEYTNGELTIIWKPKICIHATECVHRLPKVYNPKEKPWIKIENATIDEFKSQIEACPSGALSYRINNQKNNKEMETETKVEILENGPLLIHGVMEVTNSKGNKEKREKTTAFCRCGVSQNKPYCDGAHKKAKFKG